MIVVDASVVVVALIDDAEDGDRIRHRLVGERLVAPDLLDVEVVSAWRRLASAGTVADRRVELALSDLEALRVERVSPLPLLRRCWELRSNLTVYDGLYVALAEALDAVLLTADQRLADAPGVGCRVEVIA